MRKEEKAKKAAAVSAAVSPAASAAVSPAASAAVSPAASAAASPAVAFLFIFFLLSSFVFAQQAPYLVPKQIYVGDPATLVVPLPAAAQNHPDIILTKRDYLSNESIFPSHKNMEIYKITLEKRTTGSNLLIEFAAFSPGEIELPTIEIGGEFFSGLTIKVNSLLEIESRNSAGGARHLSGAASVLAMPGTALMLYGSIAAIIFLILAAIWFIFKGRAVLKSLREKWKRYRLYAGMFNTEKKLAKALSKGVDKRMILDKLSSEFREFLSILTGKNCRSMTAREFAREFACEFIPELAREAAAPDQIDEGTFLGVFFGSCDKLRFSGTDIDPNSIVKLLDDLKEFLTAKQKEEKSK